MPDERREAEGLYGPDSEAWRLNREAMLLLGAGPRALLLQLAHPQVAAGVDDHSDFRSDPWARLQATLRSYLAIVYGTKTAARAEIRRLNELHRSIRGAGYAARDPALSLWVHATLVDTTIVAYDQERVVARASFKVPVSHHPIDSVNLGDPRVGLVDRINDLLAGSGLEKGRIDISLGASERNVGLTVNEYETMLMRHDLVEVLKDPLKFAAQRGRHMIDDPLAIPTKTLNYAKYDFPRLLN